MRKNGHNIKRVTFLAELKIMPSGDTLQVCVVGNGPLSRSDREAIDKCQKVIRFNDTKNKLDYEKTDLLFLRDNGSGWWGTEKCGNTPVVLLENPDTTNQTWPHNCKVVARMRHFDTAFPGCANRKTLTAEHGASSGLMAIQALEQDKSVSSVDVFGMNWNFEQPHHLKDEEAIIRKCASKAKIHATQTASYLP